MDTRGENSRWMLEEFKCVMFEFEFKRSARRGRHFLKYLRTEWREFLDKM